MDENYYQLLPSVMAICSAAGELILSLKNQDDDLKVEFKANKTPVTEIDIAANDFIVAELEKLQTGIAIISEEVDADLSAKDSYWLVDPIDGTKGFIQGSDEYTVNVALIHNKEPILGVIQLPEHKELYYALKGQGAFKQASNGGLTRLHTAKARDKWRFVFSRFFSQDKIPLPIQNKMLGQPLQVNSSLKFALLAAGQADIYPRIGPTSQWDTAAGQSILQEAGGAVVDLDGQRLQYQLGGTILNPAFLAVGDANIIPELVQLHQYIQRGNQ
jgi:3'(2'), 5'-bisphosphate nucleotidase